MLNILLQVLKVERGGLKERLEILEATKNFEVNKTIELEDKVLKMKMIIIILYVLIVEFTSLFMMK